MEENRRFFRADVEIKSYFRPIAQEDLSSWVEQIDSGRHEDLCRHYLAGEDKFLKRLEKLTAEKEDLKNLFLFINEKVNYVLHTTSMMKEHPLNQMQVETINLGGGGCALYQDFKLDRDDFAFIEFILPRTGRYVRAVMRALYSNAVENRWRNGYVFEKITIDDQDALMGYLFQCERLDNAVGDIAHQCTKNSPPYN